MVEPHAPERPVELLLHRLLRPEFEPELVRDHDLVAPPAGGAEELSEHDFGVTGRERGIAGLIVVARVVEEVDPELARGAHHLEPLLSWDALVRSPRAEREDGDVEAGRSERAVLHQV